MIKMIDSIKNKVLAGNKISSEEAIILSKTTDKESLYNAANEIRKHFCKDNFDLCSITNAKSGKCSEDCKWCSQSVHHNTAIEEYELIDKTQAIEEALKNAEQGVHRHSLVTSGRKVSTKTLDALIPMFQEITEKTNLKLCASMGLISEEQMIRLKEEAGIDHYHCNIETAPSNFPNLVSTHTLDEKIETIKMANKHGIKVCSGGIIGMGETMEQRIEMALLLRELEVKSIPINILQAVKGTALEETPLLNEDEILTTLAIFRFINPDSRLCLAGGRVQIKHFQDKALKAGVSAAITGDYLTSTGSNTQDDIRDFKEAGFSISTIQ
jgi:biotin synthase